MKIAEKLALKDKHNHAYDGVTIAFLGDSVTQGCFELYKKENNAIETVFDKRHSYERYVFDILSVLYPTASINIINAGISGNNAPGGLSRVERDVISHNPDLTVVCFGLNDCSLRENSVEVYTEALRGIFKKLCDSGIEVIFMTPNMMNTGISPHLTDPDIVRIAEEKRGLQNGGVLASHLDSAKALCRELGIKVCDCYAIWERLYKNGVNVTELLANKINHPTREMNKLFAYELVKTMLED